MSDDSTHHGCVVNRQICGGLERYLAVRGPVGRIGRGLLVARVGQLPGDCGVDGDANGRHDQATRECHADYERDTCRQPHG